MDIVITPGQSLDGHIYALIRFRKPGQAPTFRTCRLDPEEVHLWDERVTAFILARAPEAREWQGVLWW